MEKKKRKKVKDNDAKKDQSKGQQTVPVEPDEEKPFDFGGLPDRDLKKNLGCGG